MVGVVVMPLTQQGWLAPDARFLRLSDYLDNCKTIGDVKNS